MSYCYHRVGKRGKSNPQRFSVYLLQFTAYWRAVASGINFLNFSFKKCLAAIHQDLVAIWDIREMEEVRAKDYHKCVSGFIVFDSFFSAKCFFSGCWSLCAKLRVTAHCEWIYTLITN